MKSPAWGNQEFTQSRGFTGQASAGLHDGVDIAMPIGTPLYATRDGVCQNLVDKNSVGSTPNDFALYQYITYPDGTADIYVHLNDYVASGQVKAGQLISHSGNTGYSTGPHLHFTHRTNKNDHNSAVDPTSYLTGGVPVDPTQAALQAKDQEIANLKAAIVTKDQQIDGLNNQVATLQKQVNDLTAQLAVSGVPNTTNTIQIKGLKSVTFDY